MKNCSFIQSLLSFILFTEGSFVLATDLKIELKEKATVHSSQVLLRDVARIVCADESEVARVEGLALQELDLTLESETITKNAIRTYLVFAGWSLDECSVTGAPSVEVTYQEPQLLTDADVEQEALKAIVEIMSVEEKDLSVRLQSTFVQSLPNEIRDLDGLTVKVVPPRRSLGLVLMQVQVWSGRELRISRSAAFDVRKRHRVAIAKVSLSREKPLDDRSVQFENRFFATEVDELDATQVIGQRVRSNVVAGSVIQMRDIQMTRSGELVVVKKGETVRVMAVAGKLRTELRNAEAQQDGGVGETIKLRNRDSGQEIVGKVLGPGLVRIQLK